MSLLDSNNLPLPVNCLSLLAVGQLTAPLWAMTFLHAVDTLLLLLTAGIAIDIATSAAALSFLDGIPFMDALALVTAPADTTTAIVFFGTSDHDNNLGADTTGSCCLGYSSSLPSAADIHTTASSGSPSHSGIQFLGDASGLEPYEDKVGDTFVDFVLYDDGKVSSLGNAGRFPSLF